MKINDIAPVLNVQQPLSESLPSYVEGQREAKTEQKNKQYFTIILVLVLVLNHYRFRPVLYQLLYVGVTNVRFSTLSTIAWLVKAFGLIIAI